MDFIILLFFINGSEAAAGYKIEGEKIIGPSPTLQPPCTSLNKIANTL